MISQKSFHIFFNLIAAGLLLLATSCTAFGPSFHGEIVKPVAAAPQISMTDQNGDPFSLSEQRGRVVLVFFGFTNCVDECPLTMAHLKQALEVLGEEAGNVQVVLVTTDPIRDTPNALRTYLNKFNPSFVGISGTPDELAKIWSEYGVTVEDGGQTHSSFTYVVDQDGNLRLHFDPEISPDDIASDLKNLLAS